MIPILYEKTETSFTSNGLGRLSDCIRCIVTEERNGIYECEFDYPVSGLMFEQIQEGRIIACTHDEQGDVQPFDIYGRTEPINGVVTFYAHHISYRLNEITVKPFTASSCADAFTKIVAYSIGSNPFSFWTDKNVNTEFVSATPRQIRNMLGGEENSILDVYGTGEYEFDKFNVRLYLHRGQDTNVSIRYGKNLIDYTNDYDVSGAYTAVVPYWRGEESEGEQSVSTLVMLPELFISSGQSVPSGREVVVPMDLSDAFEEPPTVIQLRSAATSRLSASQAWLPNQTVKVNFVQLWQTEEYKEYAPLQRLRLCDTCGVFVPMYGTALRAKVIRVVYNVLLDRYDEMELGDKPTTYTAIIEKVYNSKVAGVVAGLQSLAVDIETAQNIAEANAKAYSDGQLSEAVLAINSDIADLQDQIDGNITTWFFEVDPSMNTPPVTYDPTVEGSGWDTDAKKKEHLGDLYYNTTTGYAWRFVYESGVYSWSIVSDSGVAEALRIASEAKDVADSKRRIFYAEPVPPYDDGDLWTQGEDGDILRCAVPKAEGETYSRSDWILASKYTDNSALYAFIQGTFSDTVTIIEGQLDQKAETWYQSTDPSINWQTAQQKSDHVGDLWYYTGDTTSTFSKNETYRWDGSAWQPQTIPDSVFDMIDGKSQIFVGATQPTGAENGDLWFQGPDKPILTRLNGAWLDYNYYIDSSVSQAQASQAEEAAKDYADSAISGLRTELETQIDAKIETWAQASNPESSWDDRTAHNDDLWLYTGLTDIIVNGQTIRPQGVYRYSAVEGGTLCNENNNDLTDENGAVLEVANIGDWSPYASTSDNLFDLADGKSTIYYGSPTGSYPDVDSGDYLVDSKTGMTYRYQGGAWVKQTDYQTYTDNEVSALKTALETQIDAKIETWAQSTNPAAAWTTATVRQQHNGDLWLYTGTSNLTVGSVTIKPQGVYKYSGSSNTWSAYSSTSNNLFDLVDGKSTIFYGSTSGTYANKEVGDYLVDPSTGNTYRWSGSAWVKQTDYNSAIAAAKQTIEGEYAQAIEDATELIRGGTGGYVITTVNANGQPIELLITDNMDLTQAVNVWRWNRGGLGHSHSGYDGPFDDVAITQDGKINASMILTGELTANLIKAGTIQDINGYNSWNLDTGKILLTLGDTNNAKGSIEVIDASARRGVVINNTGVDCYGYGYNNISNPHIKITNSRISFKATASGSEKNFADLAFTTTGFFAIGGNSGKKISLRNTSVTSEYYDFNAGVSGETNIHAFGGMAYFAGGLTVASGKTKSREVDTDNYDKRLLYCYETPTPLFGDIGEAEIDSDGVCYVDLDDIFTETIADQVEYQVFLQKEGEGDCWIAKKTPRYFVMQGTPGLKVAWELKAKQKEFYNIRLEQNGLRLEEYIVEPDDDYSLDDYITEQEVLLYGNY